MSEEGLKQACKVSERLKDIKINSIYSSDLKRAFRTAQIVAENYNLTVQKNPDLREINFGDWEGRHYNHFKEEERDYFHKWFKEPLKYRIPGGESLPELHERVLAFLNLVVSQENEKKEEEEIIITAHGGPIKIIIAHILNMDIKNMSRLVISPA
ncbi:MAG: alpha-ribazole phosphatase, partial [Firmicutes bacterium HGW-Firmicutes-13]